MLLATRPEVGREIERSRRRGRISDTIDVSERRVEKQDMHLYMRYKDVYTILYHM